MFTFGSNKSRTTSTSQSDAYGYSVGGSSSMGESLGRSTSSGGSVARSFTDIAFADIFAELYGGATGAAGRMAESAPGFNETARQLFSSGANFLDTLSGGAGAAYLEDRVSGASPVLDDQIGALQDDLGRLFREELDPAITARAVAGGTLGGGRQGVAQGRAADAVAREFTRGATELRSADIAARDAAARDLEGLRAASAGTGLGALPGLLGVAEGGFQAEIAPYLALAQIMGGPTTLAGSESESFSESEALDIARQIAESFSRGEDFATARSSTTSKSGGFQFGFGK